MNIKRLITIKLLMLTFITIFTSSCAISSHEMKEFENSYRLYEKAIRWQDYDLMLGFHKNAKKSELTAENRKRLKQFKVSGYNILFTRIEPDEQSATQVVEVKYYNQDYNVVREMTLTNKWEWSEKKERWELANPFPDFRWSTSGHAPGHIIPVLVNDSGVILPVLFIIDGVDNVVVFEIDRKTAIKPA